MNIVALLTGRGNNTLADKNILPIRGVPLLGFPTAAAKKCAEIKGFYVSSDCEKILSAANTYGYERIKRPPEFATPTAQHRDVVAHSLRELKIRGVPVDAVLVMLANSPTIKSEWIRDCVDKLRENVNATAVVPVCRVMDHHPYRAKTLDSSGALVPFFDFAGRYISSNRQDLPPNFFLCHNFWLIKIRDYELPSRGSPPWTFMGDRVLPYEVDESFDIHNIEDLERAEKWLVRNGIV